MDVRDRSACAFVTGATCFLGSYRVLRSSNPSPYMFYFTSNDVEIAGASPETLVKLDAGRLYTYPLAGTRPRGRTPEENESLEVDLKAMVQAFIAIAG